MDENPSILEKDSTFDNQDGDQNRDGNVDSSSDYAIYLTALIIVFIFYFWLAYVISGDLYVNNITASTAVNQCYPGQCPTDYVTGEKICPSDNNGQYAYNITTQVCNYPGICQGTLPYSINSDGGSSSNGICQPDPITGLPSQCRCSAELTCPEYVLSSFNVLSGNPYSANTNTQFGQDLITTYGGTGGKLKRPNAGFCQVPLAWLLRTQPGCAGVTGANNFEVAKNCLSLNPCLQGVLAYITNNVSLITYNDLDQLPVACVRNNYFGENVNSCDIANGFLPFYDLLTGSIVCKLICDKGYQARYNGGTADGYLPPSGINGYGCYPSCNGGQLKIDSSNNTFSCLN